MVALLLQMIMNPPPLFSSPDGLGGSAVGTVRDPDAARSRYQSAGWTLDWSDDFDGEGLPDPSKWQYEVGKIRNREEQVYTSARPENTCLRDGHLVITARREGDGSITSASLMTYERYSFREGKVEIRAKVPQGRGVWVALWTLGTSRRQSGWPLCGEIDLMEYVGFDPDRFHFTVHTDAFNHVKQTQKGTQADVPNAADQFHRFGIVWDPRTITWFLDGEPVFAFENSGNGAVEWPFDEPQYLLISLAIGGTWGGSHGIDESIFPAELLVDYVRVWK